MNFDALIRIVAWSAGPNTDFFTLQSSIIDGIAGTIFQPNFDCPAEYCTWDDLTTLGVCNTYENVTDTITINCGADYEDLALYNCSYEFPDRGESEAATQENMTFGDINKDPYLRADWFRSWFTANNSPDSIETLGWIHAVKVTSYSFCSQWFCGSGPPKTESYHGEFYWCAKTFRNVTALPRELRFGAVETERLELIDEYVEPIWGTIADRYRVFVAPSSGTNFMVTVDALEYLPLYFRSLLTTSVENIYPFSPQINAVVDIANFLFTTNFENFTSNLATTLTNQIRSTNPGDNRNVTLLNGRAFVSETYIRARWQWLAFPATVTVVTTILLSLSIVINRNYPLFKGSALALLFHGLGEWPHSSTQSLNTVEDLEYTAKNMTTSLMEDDEGVLKFMKTVGGSGA